MIMNLNFNVRTDNYHMRSSKQVFTDFCRQKPVQIIIPKLLHITVAYLKGAEGMHAPLRAQFFLTSYSFLGNFV